MVVGIVAAAALCILILLYAMYKYRNRDEGSYHVDESRNYISNSAQSNGAVIKEKQPNSAKSSNKNKKNKDKEYYVWSQHLKERLYRNSLHFIWDIIQTYLLYFLWSTFKNKQTKKTGNAIRKERLFLKTSISCSCFSETGADKFPNIHSVFIYSACLYVAGTFLKDNDDTTHS